MLPPAAFQRLWLNEWVTGQGDALEAADIEAAIDPKLRPMTGVEDEWIFAGGLDLGVRRDHSAFCVIDINFKLQRMRLAHCQTWAPLPGQSVDLQAVADHVLSESQWYRCPVFYDPHQAAMLAQQLERAGVLIEAVPFTGSNLNAMASVLLQAFRERRIDLYPEPRLIEDLNKLLIVQKSYGYRLEAPRDKSGHADLATAFAIALYKSAEAMPVIDRLPKAEVVWAPDWPPWDTPFF